MRTNSSGRVAHIPRRPHAPPLPVFITITLVFVPFRGSGVAYGLTPDGRSATLTGPNEQLIGLCRQLRDHIDRGEPLVVSAEHWRFETDDEAAS